LEIFKQFLDLANAKAKILFVVFGGSLTLIISNWIAPASGSSLRKEVSDIAYLVFFFSGGSLIFIFLWNMVIFIWHERIRPWKSRQDNKKAEKLRRKKLLDLSLDELLIMSMWLAYDSRRNHIPNPNDPLLVGLEKKGLVRATFAGKLHNATSVVNGNLLSTPPPNYEIPETIWQTMREMPELRIDDREGLRAAVDDRKGLDVLKPFLPNLHPAVSSTTNDASDPHAR